MSGVAHVVHVPLQFDLPEATLAAVVIAAVWELIDVPALRELYRVYSRRLGRIYGHDARPDFVAAVAALVGVLVFDTLLPVMACAWSTSDGAGWAGYGLAGRPGAAAVRGRVPMPQISLPIGPVEYLAVAFPGSKFSGQIVPALQELIANGTVHILDLAFVTKGADGSVLALELDDLEDDDQAAFDALDGEIDSLLSEEDLLMMAEAIEPGSSAAIIVWENSWAARLVGALRAADAEVVAHERVPVAVVEEVVAALAEA